MAIRCCTLRSGRSPFHPTSPEKVPYNPRDDLAPVVLVATAPTVLVTAIGSRHSNLAGLVAYAKANPGRVSFASSGPGTTTQFGSELLKREAGIDMIHIPYKGAAAARTDVMAGIVDVMFVDALAVIPFVRSGKLKALAIGAPDRANALAQVPTAAEAGQKGFLVSTWYGLLAPARTSPAVIVKLNKVGNEVLVSPEVKTFFAAQGLQSNGGSAQEFGAFTQSESTRWSALAKAAGVKMG